MKSDLRWPPWWIEQPDGTLLMTAALRHGPRLEYAVIASLEMVEDAEVPVLEMYEQEALEELAAALRPEDPTPDPS